MSRDNTIATRGNVIPFPARPRTPTGPCSRYQATMDLWTGQSPGYEWRDVLVGAGRRRARGVHRQDHTPSGLGDRI
jgi:hypothetical protein